MLIIDWKHLIKNAWSIRLMVLAGILSGAEVLMSFYPNMMPPLPYAGASALLSMAALVARVVAQKRFLKPEVSDDVN